MQNVSLRGRRQNEEGRKRKSGGWKHVNYLAEKCTSIEQRLHIKIGKDTSQITCQAGGDALKVLTGQTLTSTLKLQCRFFTRRWLSYCYLDCSDTWIFENRVTEKINSFYYLVIYRSSPVYVILLRRCHFIVQPCSLRISALFFRFRPRKRWHILRCIRR